MKSDRIFADDTGSAFIDERLAEGRTGEGQQDRIENHLSKGCHLVAQYARWPM